MSILKNITAYYIKTKEIKDPILKECIEDGILEIFKKVFDVEDTKFIVFGNEKYDGSGYDFLYLFVEEFKTKQIINFLSENNVLDVAEDVTNDIKTSKIYDNNDFSKVYFGYPESKDIREELGDKYTEEFKYIFDNFILDNLTPDDILDKINERGIESLTDIDKKILES